MYKLIIISEDNVKLIVAFTEIRHGNIRKKSKSE